MKVKDLIEKLEKVDGELDVFAAPITITELFGVIGDTPSRSEFTEGDTVKLPDPESRYPVVSVHQGSTAEMVDDRFEWHVILGFDADPAAGEGEELLN